MVQKGNRAEAAFLITATAVGAFLRFYRIGKECLWFDEICTIGRASLSFNAIIDDLTRTILFPPLYFFLVKIWLYLAGSTPVALRSFSALWGTAAIPIAYLLAREMFGRKAAIVSSILLVFSSFNIYYSQEAKMYAMCWTLILASNLFFVRAIKYGARWPDLSLYVAATAAAFLTHNFTALVILSQLIFLAVVLRPRDGRARWLLAYVLVALLYCLWVLIFLVNNYASSGEGVVETIISTKKAIQWIPRPSARDFFISFVIFASGVRFYAYDDTWLLSWHMPFPYANYLCLLALALLLYPALRERQDRWRFPSLIALLILFPSVSAFLYSWLVRPLWQLRYIGFIAPIFFIALGYGYRLSSWRSISTGALILLLVLNLSILDFYYSDRVKKPWDDLVVYLSPRVEEGARVLFPQSFVQKTFEYYWNLDEERSKKKLKLEFSYGEREEMRERIADFNDVWAVLSYTMPRGQRRWEKTGMEVSGYRHERMFFGNGLEIVHYIRER